MTSYQFNRQELVENDFFFFGSYNNELLSV